MYEKGEKVVILCDKLEKYWSSYSLRNGTIQIPYIATDKKEVLELLRSGTGFGSVLRVAEGKNNYAVLVDVLYEGMAREFVVYLPAPVLRGERDKDFKEGDMVYVKIPPREEWHKGFHFIPRMEEMAKIGPWMVEEVKDAWPDERWKYFDVGGFRFLKDWLSYLPQEGQLIKKEPVDIPKEVERLKKEALEEFREVDLKEYLEDSSYKASMIFIHDLKGLRKEVLPEEWCHSPLQRNWGEVYSFIDMLDLHFLRPCEYYDPFSREDFSSAFARVLEYWVNRGPFKHVFKTKNTAEILESGLEYDTSYSCSAIACAAIGLRSFAEFPEKSILFEEASKRWSEHVAAIVACCTYLDEEEGWYLGYKNYHDLIGCLNSAREIYEGWINGFDIKGKPMNKGGYGYSIHESIADYSDSSRNMFGMLNDVVEEDIEDFLDAVEHTRFFREIVNG